MLPPRTPSAAGYTAGSTRASLKHQSLLLTAQQENRIMEKIASAGGRVSPDGSGSGHLPFRRRLVQEPLAEEIDEDEEEGPGPAGASAQSRSTRKSPISLQTHRNPGTGPEEPGLLGDLGESFYAPEAFYDYPVGSRVALVQSKRVASEPESSIPLDVQEALVMQDLLHLMAGVSGQYVAFAEQTERGKEPFEFSSQIDASLVSLARQVLPTAMHIAAIRQFVYDQSSLASGCVSQALCAEIRTMIKEHNDLLACLEQSMHNDPDFTLHSMRFQLEKAKRITSFLYEIVVTVHTANELHADDDESSGSDSDSDSADGMDEKVKQIMREANGDGIKPADLGPLRGSDLLKVISDLVTLHGGDDLAREVFLRLLTAASQPYIRILLEWISSGRLNDSFHEFFITESVSASKDTAGEEYTDDYWDRRYIIREPQAESTLVSDSEDPLTKIAHTVGRGSIPGFIQGSEQKIFLAGKFLNVIKECGAEGMDAGVEDAPDFAHLLQSKLTISLEDPRLTEAIEAAYTHANQTLLDLLLKSQHLMPRLRALKHYFFMDQADFLTHFLDIAGYELSKKSKHISLTKVQSLLDIALHNPASVTSSDPYKEDVRVGMGSSTLADWLIKVIGVNGPGLGPIDAVDGIRDLEEEQTKTGDSAKQVTGYDALTLNFEVKFPVSLVISKRIVLRYQLLFRHILQMKHIEQMLAAVWLEHFKTSLWRKRTNHRGLENWKLRVFALRSKMLSFVQHLIFYATNEVIEPNWRLFEKKVAKVKTVDLLMKDLLDFLDDSLKACMLTNSKLLRIYSKLLMACTLFANYTSRFSKSLSSALASLAEANGDPEQVSMEAAFALLQKFETNWKHHQTVFIEFLEYYSSIDSVALTSLSTRLDYRRRVPE